MAQLHLHWQTFMSCSFTSLLLILCLPTTTTFAQTNPVATPYPVQEMAFMRAGSKLYIQGGKNLQNGRTNSISPQLFSLDLAKSWPVTAPAWEGLASNQAVNLHVGVATPDNSTLITFYNKPNGLNINKYTIATNTWDTLILDNLAYELRQAIRAIVDPATGKVYINAATWMDIFDPSDNSVQLVPYPPNSLNSRFFPGAVYNKARNSLMYMGGTPGSLQHEPNMYISEFNLNRGSWSVFNTKGKIPTPRTDHCMASSDDGNTVVVFGGRVPMNTTETPPSNFTGTLYILDVPTATWIEGPTAPKRLYMACIIVGTQFLVWGGFNGRDATINGPPIVLDLNSKQWVDKYTAPDYYLYGTPDSGSAPVDGSSSSDMGAILGGVFGGLFVVSMTGLTYVWMKRRDDKTVFDQQMREKILTEAEKTNASTADSFRPIVEPPRNPHSMDLSFFSSRNPQIASGIGSSDARPQDPQLFSEAMVPDLTGIAITSPTATYLQPAMYMADTSPGSSRRHLDSTPSSGLNTLIDRYVEPRPYLPAAKGSYSTPVFYPPPPVSVSHHAQSAPVARHATPMDHIPPGSLPTYLPSSPSQSSEQQPSASSSSTATSYTPLHQSSKS